MNHEEFRTLIKKYQLGELSPEQTAVLDKWFEMLGSADRETWTNAELDMLQKEMMENISRKIRQKRLASPLKRWLPYAAAVLFFIGFGLYYYQLHMFKSGGKESEMVREFNAESEVNIPPGMNKATLKLADGRIVQLSSEHTGIIVGHKLVYDDGTSLLGEDENTSRGDNHAVSEYVLSTPPGGQYQMTLPDGSRVWLNASSTLRYPSRFTGDHRAVKLIGEAYFEIAKQKGEAGFVPFVVETAEQEVKVLGTQFNIAAYADETETRTTLVEGGVTVRRSVNDVADSEPETKLRPGEESVLTAKGIQTRKANLISSTAWKSGIFVFDNTSFDQMMKQIARWYNIEVVYENEIPKELFKGKMSRNVNLQVLINFLRDSGIELRVKGRTLYISN